MDDFIWIQKWFAKQCDGYWEHDHGVTVQTLDNPGWLLRVEFEETELENVFFENIKIDRTDDDWIRCKVENKMFKGYGGPSNLPEILNIFRTWAEKNQQ